MYTNCTNLKDYESVREMTIIKIDKFIQFHVCAQGDSSIDFEKKNIFGIF